MIWKILTIHLLILLSLAIFIVYQEVKEDDMHKCKQSGIEEFWSNTLNQTKEGKTFFYNGFEIIPRLDGGITIRKEK